MSEDDDDEIERDENRPASVFPGEERGSYERTDERTNERRDRLSLRRHDGGLSRRSNSRRHLPRLSVTAKPASPELNTVTPPVCRVVQIPS